MVYVAPNTDILVWELSLNTCMLIVDILCVKSTTYMLSLRLEKNIYKTRCYCYKKVLMTLVKVCSAVKLCILYIYKNIVTLLSR